jgi:hypothetical protein
VDEEKGGRPDLCIPTAFRERLGDGQSRQDASLRHSASAAAAKNKFMENHRGVFEAMAQVLGFVAEQAMSER